MRLPFASPKRPNEPATRVLSPPAPHILKELEYRDVPIVRLPDCATCDDPCEGDEAYAKLDIDLTDVPLMNSVKQYGRIALVSTGRSDWPREVTEVEGSLAQLVHQAYDADEKARPLRPSSAVGDDSLSSYPSSLTTRRSGGSPHRKITILNSSHLSPSSLSSVLIFPDYKIVQEVQVDQSAASALVSAALSPDAPPTAPGSPFRSWPLAYRAVILVCSHKRRDNRCSVVAPYMIAEFTKALQDEGFDVDERGDEAEHGPEPCIEEWPDEGSDRETRYEKARRTAAASTQVGIFKVSHVGGHRWAGNAIVCLPSGAAVWYGKVGPRECSTIVKETIVGGRVIAELLRGGMGLENRRGSKGILDW